MYILHLALKAAAERRSGEGGEKGNGREGKGRRIREWV